jgi:YD repeat-containing protein
MTLISHLADGSNTTYIYDKGNRLTQVVDSIAGTITRSYDGLNRITSETTPQGSVSYSYDAASRRATMTVIGQPSVLYSYDNANRLTQITQGSAIVSYTYDAAGRRTSVTLPNNVLVEYAYDSASRLTGITYKQNGTTVLGNLPTNTIRTGTEPRREVHLRAPEFHRRSVRQTTTPPTIRRRSATRR